MIPTRPHRAKWIHAEGACSVYKSHLVDCTISHNIHVSRIVVQTSRRWRTMLISLRFLQCEELTPVKASTARPSVMEYPFCRITMGSSTTDFELGSLVLLMEAMPIAETTKSNEWTTRGNRINPEASSSLQRFAMEPPRIMALMTSAAILSNKSAPRAAQSPTLSPTCIGRQGVKHSSVHRKYLKDC
jgi:hypothetical protein